MQAVTRLTPWLLLVGLVALIELLPTDARAGWKGCRPAAIEAGVSNSGCVKVGGHSRRYRLHLPKGYHGERLPLVIGLHGGGGKPRQFEGYSALSQVSDRTGSFIVVYPKGVDGHWNDGRPGVNAQVDDLAFLAALIDHLDHLDEVTIDRRRVFVVGMSNGGLMALRVGCERPDLVAGLGVVAAALPPALARHCDGPPVPILFVFGSDDTSFLADGRQVNPVKPAQVRGRHIGIERTVRRWARRNGCRGEPTASAPIDRFRKKHGPLKDDHTQVIRRRYGDCNAPVVWYDVEGGGHRWPDPSARNGRLITQRLHLGWASHEITTAKILWRFWLSLPTGAGR